MPKLLSKVGSFTFAEFAHILGLQNTSKITFKNEFCSTISYYWNSASFPNEIVSPTKSLKAQRDKTRKYAKKKFLRRCQNSFTALAIYDRKKNSLVYYNIYAIYFMTLFLP